MTKMQIMQVFPQSTNTLNGLVRQFRAFGEHDVANLCSVSDDSLNSVVCDKRTCGQIEHAQMIEWPCENEWWELLGELCRGCWEWVINGRWGCIGSGRRRERSVRQLCAMREPHLTHVGGVKPYVAHGFVG